MDYEIAPEPDEAERQAILSALAAEEAERARSSAWADVLLPASDFAEGPEP